jgi:hypothetical protein
MTDHHDRNHGHDRDEGDHDRYAELVAADVLDGLDPPDRADLTAIRTAHGPDCADCRHIDTDFAETAADLALTLPPIQPHPHAADRLLTAAIRPAAASPTAHQVPVDPARTGAEDRATENRSAATPVPTIVATGRRRSRVLLAAAAAVILFAAGGGIGYALRGSGHPNTTSAVAAYLAQPGTRAAAFPTTGDTALSVLYRPGHTTAWLVGSNLPAPSADHVYELWYQPVGGHRMHPAGTFSGGTVHTTTTLASSIAALAVSIEPHGGSPQPTTTPIYTLTVKP